MREFGVDEWQEAHFFHLVCQERPPKRWQHEETGGGVHEPILFELYWVRMPSQVPPFNALDGTMLARLYDALGIASPPAEPSPR
jgi:hypothetical protein